MKKSKWYQGANLEEIQAKIQKPQKLDHPVFDTGVSSFSRTDRVRLGFEVYFV
jgi:hypothetical protein